MSNLQLCDYPKCPVRAGHQTAQYGRSRALCCYHHVAEGDPPADWHTGCMTAYAADVGKRPIIDDPTQDDAWIATVASAMELSVPEVLANFDKRRKEIGR